MSRRFDAIIIGAGQAGPPLAGRLTGAGMSVALIERHLFGGTCVNTGCTPTKTLVASAYAAHVARRSAEYGVMLGGPLRIDMARAKAGRRGVSEVARRRRALAARHERLHGYQWSRFLLGARCDPSRQRDAERVSHLY
jgi:pyruvate/2-oxoglutarate dehydrogenase complex dihydrolipoamide dehydrogenase (E3) component